MPNDIIPALFSNVWSVFLVVLFFGGSIFVHELGHFLAARRRGLHVTRFSIGFGPKIFGWTGKDGVEYRLSWLPLGGYVALPQLADMREIEGAPDADSSELPPVSYASKVIVFAAGAAFNVLFAFALACILWVAGTSVAKEEQSTRIGIAREKIELSAGKPYVPGPAYAAGLRAKDTILAVDGKSVSSFSDIAQLVALGSGRDAQGHPQVAITYERDGKQAVALVRPELVDPDQVRDIGVEPVVKATVAAVTAGSVAEAGGIKPGDVITYLDGHPVEYTSFISDSIREGTGRQIELKLQRDSQEIVLKLQPRKIVDPETKAETYRLGLQLRSAYTFKTVHIAPWVQIQQHLLYTWRGLMSLINPHTDVGISKLTGPVGIVRIFHSAAEAGIATVLSFTILININLALLNLLPIPVLDGGHILFATIGRLRGRALPQNFIMSAQSLFLVLIFSMILYVSFFDVRRWSRDAKAAAAAAAPPPTATAPASTPAAGK